MTVMITDVHGYQWGCNYHKNRAEQNRVLYLPRKSCPLPLLVPLILSNWTDYIIFALWHYGATEQYTSSPLSTHRKQMLGSVKHVPVCTSTEGMILLKIMGKPWLSADCMISALNCFISFRQAPSHRHRHVTVWHYVDMAVEHTWSHVTVWHYVDMAVEHTWKSLVVGQWCLKKQLRSLHIHDMYVFFFRRALLILRSLWNDYTPPPTPYTHTFCQTLAPLSQSAVPPHVITSDSQPSILWMNWRQTEVISSWPLLRDMEPRCRQSTSVFRSKHTSHSKPLWTHSMLRPMLWLQYVQILVGT